MSFELSCVTTHLMASGQIVFHSVFFFWWRGGFLCISGLLCNPGIMTPLWCSALLLHVYCMFNDRQRHRVCKVRLHRRLAHFPHGVWVLNAPWICFIGPSKPVFYLPFLDPFSIQTDSAVLALIFHQPLPRCWGFSLGLTRESLRYHFRLMVRRIWP